MVSKPAASYEVIVLSRVPAEGQLNSLRIMRLKRLSVSLKADVSLNPTNTTELCQKTHKLTAGGAA